MFAYLQISNRAVVQVYYKMAEPTQPKPSSSTSFLLLLFLLLVSPVLLSFLLYQLYSFDAAPLPMHELTRDGIVAPLRNGAMLSGAEKIGVGQLVGPEDVVYDPDSGIMYTGCADGWIKRVTVNDSAEDSVVEEWVNTGGRPLGLGLGHQKELIIGDADKGLLKVSRDGVIELLTDSAEGQLFKLTDGVDIAKDGIIYFTDASYKYSLHDNLLDILEGRPYGRLLRYNPLTRETKVLVRDLYFANGVAVSPDQKFVVFCETPMRRCKKYYLEGERKGHTDTFVDRLPGLPDNIHCDEEGNFWIAIVMEVTDQLHLSQTYPFIRKLMGLLTKYWRLPPMSQRNSGPLVVNSEGKPIAHYQDPAASVLTSAIKIGDHLYAGSAVNSYIIRLNVTRYPATPTL